MSKNKTNIYNQNNVVNLGGENLSWWNVFSIGFRRMDVIYMGVSKQVYGISEKAYFSHGI